jgi:hypothetical protein
VESDGEGEVPAAPALRSVASSLIEERPSTPTKRWVSKQETLLITELHDYETPSPRPEPVQREVSVREPVKREGTRSFLDQMRTVKPSGQIGRKTLVALRMDRLAKGMGHEKHVQPTSR